MGFNPKFLYDKGYFKPVGAKKPARKRGNPEGVIQLKIIKSLRARGHYCAKLKTKGSSYKGRFIFDPYTAVGCPDLIVFSPALAFIEVKAGKNGQTPEQVQFQARCNSAGIPYILARDVDSVLSAIK